MTADHVTLVRCASPAGGFLIHLARDIEVGGGTHGWLKSLCGRSVKRLSALSGFDAEWYGQPYRAVCEKCEKVSST